MIGRCNLHLIQYPSRVKIGRIPSIANKLKTSRIRLGGAR